MKYITCFCFSALFLFAVACTPPSPSSAVDADQMEQSRSLDAEDFVGGGDTTVVKDEE